MERILTRKNTLIFIGIITAFRMFIAGSLQLHPDEAYYWLWSEHINLSYFDHPPMVSYFVWFTTILFNSELWVRLSCIFVSVISSFLVWDLAEDLYRDEAVSSASVILLNVFPLTMTGSILLTPDVPAFLFWTLALVFFYKAYKNNKTHQWYLFGVSFGLAMLSKYTAVLLLPCLFIFMLFQGNTKRLKNIHFYGALVIALIVFTPVVYWNMKNNWISFRFQLGHGLGGAQYKISNLLEYVGGQLMVAGPITWLVGIYASVKYSFSYKKEKSFVALTSLPIIAFFAFSSLKKPGEANWPALAYISFSIVLARYLISGKTWKKVVFCVSVLFCVVLSMLAILHARFEILPLNRMNKEWEKADATSWFYGWRDLSSAIDKYDGKAEFVVTTSHQLSAELSYYNKVLIPVHIDRRATRPSQFNMWNYDRFRGKKGLYVFNKDAAIGPYSKYFGVIISSESIKVKRADRYIREYGIIYGDIYNDEKL